MIRTASRFNERRWKALQATCLLAFAVFAELARADSLAPSSRKEACIDWSFAQQSPNPTTRKCLERAIKGGRLSNFSISDFYKAEEVYYAEAALNGNKDAAVILKLLVDERERKKPPKGRRSTAPYGAFLMTNQIAEAENERLVKNLPLPRLVMIKSSVRGSDKLSTYWTYENDQALHARQIDLTSGNHVIVYSSPGCGVCTQAANELASNKVFKELSIWIEVPNANLSFDYHDSWKARNPDFPMNAMFDRSHWPERKVDGTPYFILIKDGAVLGETLGWSSESKERFLAQLQLLGNSR